MKEVEESLMKTVPKRSEGKMSTIPEQFPDQLSEINPLLSDEVERQLATIPLIFGVDDLHGQLLRSDFSLAKLERLELVLSFRSKKAEQKEKNGSIKRQTDETRTCISEEQKKKLENLLDVLLIGLPINHFGVDFLLAASS